MEIWSNWRRDAPLKGTTLVAVLDESIPTASQRNQMKSLDELRNYLFQGTPVNPTGAAWVTKPTVSESTGTVTIGSGSATWNGATVAYTGRTETVTYPTEGLLRQDVVVALQDGTFLYIEGDAATTAITPNYPSNGLWVAYILFSASGGKVQEPAVYYWGSMQKSGTDAQTIEQYVESRIAPVAPTGRALKNEITVEINPSGEIVTGAGVLLVNGVEYAFSANNFGVPVLPAAGFYRVHTIVASYSEQYGASIQKVAQVTDQQHIIRPALAPGDLWVRDIVLTATGAIPENATYLTHYEANRDYIRKDSLTPQTLADAATVTLNGALSTNGNLSNPATLTTLAFSNTTPGFDYRVAITGATARTITLGAATGVTYKALNGDTVTSIDIPAGDCHVIVYQESDGVRKVAVLDGSESTGTTVTDSAVNGNILVDDVEVQVWDNSLNALKSELHNHTNKGALDKVTDAGDGTAYLANDGTYKAVSAGGSTVTDSATNGNIVVDGSEVQVYDDTRVVKTSDGTVMVLDMSTYAPGFIVKAHDTQAGVLVFIDPATLGGGGGSSEVAPLATFTAEPQSPNDILLTWSI
jgi:uncharacterized Zn-binding protein involved in type VI secretion